MDRKKVVDSLKLKELILPLGAILLGLLVGGIVILWIGRNPFAAYASLFYGAFGDLNRFANTIARATPLILTGLAVAFAFRCGLFNIGVEGQLLIGALSAAFVGTTLSGLPAIIHLPLTILSAMAASALWAAIPGILKAKRGVHEVINTIMMNFIAYAFVAYIITGPLKAPGQIPKSADILASAQLIRLSELAQWSTSRLNTGILIALLACVVIYYLLWKTTIGYEIRAVGLNPFAAEYGGISVNRNIILAMVISGVLAGLAGAERVLGFHGSFILGFSPGYGFEGIAVALLGKNHPVGVILAAILFGSLSSGGRWMAFNTGVPTDIVTILQAVIIFFVAAEQIVAWFFRNKKKTRQVA
jgi:simple sugar transport system permease protein